MSSTLAIASRSMSRALRMASSRFGAWGGTLLYSGNPLDCRRLRLEKLPGPVAARRSSCRDFAITDKDTARGRGGGGDLWAKCGKGGGEGCGELYLGWARSLVRGGLRRSEAEVSQFKLEEEHRFMLTLVGSFHSRSESDDKSIFVYVSTIIRYDCIIAIIRKIHNYLCRK